MNSILNYMGGKSLLTKRIIPLIPEHHSYCEVFAGAAWLLSKIQGKFIMSINDVPEIRELFKGFHIEEAATSYSAAGAHRKKQVTELLIMNY